MSNDILTACADAMHRAIKDPDIDIEGVTSAVQEFDPTAVALLFGDEGAISYPHVVHVDGMRWRMEYDDCGRRVIWESYPAASTSGSSLRRSFRRSPRGTTSTPPDPPAPNGVAPQRFPPRWTGFDSRRGTQPLSPTKRRTS